MKITKEQLKQIIMEELNEAWGLRNPSDYTLVPPEMEKIDVTDPKQVQNLYPYLGRRALEAEISARGGAEADSPLWKLMTEPQLRLWLYQIGGPKAPEDY